ncbi:DUF1016 N-terminal domain-containing protein [Thauera sinica]|uniref:DUF1016 N-terminal domain-containing protein n=1 Tax=Thauera sinica TaxID=2665146 RepID=A0ABW1AXS4_9RHOO|nr:DUF1016 N-terminal domain-containing protein [Thauera sp. K11]
MSQVPAITAAGSLHAELRALIASSRQRLAGAVNAELTRLYWTIGQRLDAEVLGGERASYGTALLDQCVIHPNTTTQSDPNPTSHSG